MSTAAPAACSTGWRSQRAGPGLARSRAMLCRISPARPGRIRGGRSCPRSARPAAAAPRARWRTHPGSMRRPTAWRGQRSAAAPGARCSPPTNPGWRGTEPPTPRPAPPTAAGQASAGPAGPDCGAGRLPIGPADRTGRRGRLAAAGHVAAPHRGRVTASPWPVRRPESALSGGAQLPLDAGRLVLPALSRFAVRRRCGIGQTPYPHRSDGLRASRTRSLAAAARR